MPRHAERRRTPYGAQEMFDLVADIERYPEFLPWCRQMRVRERRRHDNTEVVVADMVVAFKMISERFTSRVTLDHSEWRIDVAYLDGPFRYLKNHWLFESEPDGGACIDFFIEFEFRSRALQMLAGSVFHRALMHMIAAFEARARALHGPAHKPHPGRGSPGMATS